MNSTPPFRTNIRCPDSILSADDISLLRDFRIAQVTQETLERAVTHHNELILWEAAAWVSFMSSTVIPREGWNSYLREYCISVLRRALDDADVEELAWTPVLDVLAQTNWWKETAIEKQASGDESIPTPNARMTKLIEWLQQNPPREAIEECLRFRAPIIKETIARHAPVLADWLLDELLNDARIAQILVQNPAASQETKERIADWICKKWEAEVANEGATIITYIDLERRMENWRLEGDVLANLIREGLGIEDRGNIVDRARKLSTELRAKFSPLKWAACLKEACERVLLEDPDLTKDDIEHAVQKGSAEIAARAILHPKATSADIEEALYERPLRSARAVALAALRLANDTIDENLLLRFLELRDVKVTDAIILHPATTPRVFRKIAEGRLARGHMMSLAQTPNARRIPEIRKRLLKSNKNDVLLALLEDKIPEEFPDLFARLAKNSPEAAMALVIRGDVPAGIRLSPKIVTEILSRVSQFTRADAITYLVPLVDGQGEISAAIEPQQSNKGRRRTQ